MAPYIYLVRVTRTAVAKIDNQSQVEDDLDRLGIRASKLWNVGIHRTRWIWDEIGHIPGRTELQKMLKTHECYKCLPSQTAQQVLQEVAEAYRGWFELRKSNKGHNPPGYRKRGNEHPHSTLTWKQSKWVDEQNNYIRLSDAKNYEYILCKYVVDVCLCNVNEVKAVHKGDKWQLHITYEKEVPEPESAGDRAAGVDLGIVNPVVISFGDEFLLYQGNSIREDKHYFSRVEYRSEGQNGLSEQASCARRKLRRRSHHFRHSLAKHIIEQCVERGVGKLVVGDLTNIRQDTDWGRHGNKLIHNWDFAILIGMLTYKGAEHGVKVVQKSERGTSTTCPECDHKSRDNRIERGLFKCQKCDLVGNSDCIGAENIRTLIQTSVHSEPDMDNGCVAQPSVYVFDKHNFVEKEDIDCKPKVPKSTSTSDVGSTGLKVR